MDIFMYFQTVSAVFVGAMAALVYGWFLWHMAKGDRNGMTLEDLPLRVLLVGAGVPLLMALPLILMR